MRDSRQNIVVFVLGLLLVSYLINVPRMVVAQSDDFTPSSVSIQGEIVNNYANISYHMVFDNTGSTEAREVEWLFRLDQGIRLSNISIVLGNLTYWGRAEREAEAIEEYNESVAANETAVLVMRVWEGYSISLNVANHTLATVTVFMEGLLTRRLGLYSIDLPISDEDSFQTAFELDLIIRSSYGPIAGYALHGISGFTALDLSDGIQFTFSASPFYVPEKIELSYALDRQTGGSQLFTYTNGTDNFFTYLLAPSVTEESDTLQRQVVFVLDCSGSMSGTKIVQAKIAFNTMIEDLDEDDLFNVVSFSSEVTTLWTEAHSASATHIAQAQTWVNTITADGSTNFHGACLTGLDTFVDNEDAKVMLILSDGRPTAGVTTDSHEIQVAINEANSLDVSISTVAFGYDADESLMVNIAAQNDGFFAIIEESEDAATELFDFYKVFSTPIADDYSIQITGALDFAYLQPLSQSPFFNGTEILVSGRYASSLTIETSIDYVTGTEEYTNTATVPSSDNVYIELIWAQQRIGYLLDMIGLEGETESLTEQLISIALYYGIVVEGYTALILVAYETQDTGFFEQVDLARQGATGTIPYAAAPGAPVTHMTTALDGFFMIAGIGIVGVVIIVIIRKRRL